MATDKPRFSLTLDEDTFSKVLDYKERHGYSTKSRAIQALVEKSLAELKEQGVLDAEKPSRSRKDEALLNLFHQLSDTGQDQVIDYADTLIASGKFSRSKKGTAAG